MKIAESSCITISNQLSSQEAKQAHTHTQTPALPMLHYIGFNVHNVPLECPPHPWVLQALVCPEVHGYLALLWVLEAQGPRHLLCDQLRRKGIIKYNHFISVLCGFQQLIVVPCGMANMPQTSRKKYKK